MSTADREALEARAEELARKDCGELDWSDPSTLGNTARQRAAFRRGYFLGGIDALAVEASRDPTPETDRAEFESWARERWDAHTAPRLLDMDGGKYLYLGNEWAAWQAALSAAPPAEPQAGQPEQEDLRPAGNQTLPAQTRNMTAREAEAMRRATLRAGRVIPHPDARDAARYRWLRDRYAKCCAIGESGTVELHAVFAQDDDWPADQDAFADFDAAVDSAMEGGPDGN